MAKLLDIPKFQPSDLISADLERLNDIVTGIKELVPPGRVIATFSSKNPGDTIGGSWQSLGPVFLYGCESDGQINEKGGAITHYHRENIGWDPSNGIFAYSNGGMPYFGSEKIPDANSFLFKIDGGVGKGQPARIGHTDDAGNLPPYVRVFFWRRVA